jgi:riboflavin kinase/FMN adenylyltransferase
MKKSVVAIGNFDGLHIGHVHILSHAKNIALRHGYDLCVLTFSPHPRQFFQPNIAPFRIAPDHVKIRLISDRINPDHYTVLNFDTKLHNKTADDFIDEILLKQCNAGIVIVGQDFHFGHGRSGNIETLSTRPEFETIATDLLKIDDMPVTSSRIRNHLKSAELKQANTLLGWDWYIESEIIHGDKRGRELGYPTANMHFGDSIVPAHGVYAVQVKIEGESQWRNGAANIGIRPMFETAMPMCETYIFDFDREIYGLNLKVKPVQKLRDEMKFDNLDDLIAQMAKDCATSRALLETQ